VLLGALRTFRAIRCVYECSVQIVTTNIGCIYLVYVLNQLLIMPNGHGTGGFSIWKDGGFEMRGVNFRQDGGPGR
jgi:hypothetical protein